RIDGDIAEGQIVVEVLIRADVAAAASQPQLDLQLAALADGGDVHVPIQHFDVGVGFDLRAAHVAGAFHVEAHRLDPLAHQLERNLFQVQDDVGGVLHHARYPAEFVLDAFDADGRD